MSLLVFFILLSIGVSFVCSMLEAVILSVTPSYLGSLKTKHPKLYERVHHLKEDIEKPLASILTFNTIAHTVGAAGAGAQAQKLFGSEVLALFSAILTFAILFFSEIIPKSIGASSWKRLLPLAVTTLRPMIILSYPIVWLSDKVSSLFGGKKEVISRDEIIAMTDLGLDDGALEKSEHKALRSLIEFDNEKATNILTPLSVVQSFSPDLSLNEAYEQMRTHSFSRIPVVGNKKPIGYVLRNQLHSAYVDEADKTLSDLTIPIVSLPEDVSLPELFRRLLRRREHMCAIVSNATDEFKGIITLEDLIEHMLDLEIYDEQDI